ncbi:integrase core domain-containing protein [Streptomyces sp. NPDC017230]|uniref:integrase core domain-containing protein n=1 Tax=unclassified Streptomyces TaxID=2593676 RepID=UPI0037A96629
MWHRICCGEAKLRRPWKTLSHIELATAEWVDWYNHRRLHGEIRHPPPVEVDLGHLGRNTGMGLRAYWRTGARTC